MILQGFLVLAATFGMLSLEAAAADAQQTYKEAVEALYSLEFDTAEEKFESLIRLDPDNPSYWNYLSSALWLRVLYEQQKMNLESYAGPSFGARGSRDAIDPKEEQRLRGAIVQAIAKSEAILKKKPADIQALYAQGVAYATLASFEGTAKRSYRSAYRAARRARELHKQVLQLDSSFDDARLSVGIYDYVLGSVPGWIRFFLGIIGIRGGDKAAGIQQLNDAARKGKWVSTDAKMLLAVVYNREKRYEKAFQLLAELHERYPRNFLFELGKASVSGKMKKQDQAVQIYEGVLDKVRNKKDGYERLRPERVLHEIGKAHIERLDLDTALKAFSRIVASPKAFDNEKAEAYLWMGKIFDSRNERGKALEQYDALLALNCEGDLKEEAQRYRRRPYK